MDALEALKLLVEADRRANQPSQFVLTYTGGPFNAVIVGHPGWPQEQTPPGAVLLDELADRDWVVVTSRDGKQRHFRLAQKGRDEWAAHERAAQPPAAAVDLDWSEARVLLHDLYDMWLVNGAADEGIYLDSFYAEAVDLKQTEALVRELCRDGYLDVTFNSADGPRGVRPSSKTLKLEAGWPAGTGEAAIADLVQALDREISQTPEQSKKRSVLLAMRDGVIGLGGDFFLAYVEKKAGI
jgi:hypothetical protein